MDRKQPKSSGTPDICPLVFDKGSKKACSVKLIPCKIYSVYGFCPIYSTWKASKKFCTIHLEEGFV